MLNTKQWFLEGETDPGHQECICDLHTSLAKFGDICLTGVSARHAS